MNYQKNNNRKMRNNKRFRMNSRKLNKQMKISNRVNIKMSQHQSKMINLKNKNLNKILRKRVRLISDQEVFQRHPITILIETNIFKKDW